jgi:hypothetical protein
MQRERSARRRAHLIVVAATAKASATPQELESGRADDHWVALVDRSRQNRNYAAEYKQRSIT